MISCMILHMISCYAQDCVVVLAPYPNNPNPVESFNITTDFDLQGDCMVWRPQVFFNCTLCPTGAKGSGYRASQKEVLRSILLLEYVRARRYATTGRIGLELAASNVSRDEVTRWRSTGGGGVLLPRESSPSRPPVGRQNGGCWMPFEYAYGGRQICNSRLDQPRMVPGPWS